jgi:hypothetical protein
MINPSLLTSERPLKLKVSDVSATQAVLALPDDQKICIHPKFLPSDISEGDVVFLNLLSESELHNKREDVARAVLEEILEK